MTKTRAATATRWSTKDGTAAIKVKTEKFCNLCKVIHPISFFGKDLETSDGYRNKCLASKRKKL